MSALTTTSTSILTSSISSDQWNRTVRRTLENKDSIMPVVYTFYSLLILVGTPLNLWMLGAIVTAPEIRSRLRSKIICVSLVVNAIKSTLLASLDISLLIHRIEYKTDHGCSLITLSQVIRLTIICTENWYFVLLLAVVIATVARYNPAATLGPTSVRVGTFLVVFSPWLISFVTVPSVAAVISQGPRTNGCFGSLWGSLSRITTAGLSVPYFVKIALLVAMLIAHHYYVRGGRGDDQKEITESTATNRGPAPQPDKVWAYVAACALSLVTEAPGVISNMADLGLDTRYAKAVFYLIRWYLIEVQLLIIPPCFLMLDDIRYRLKTWRPWYRPGPGIDLTVEYKKQESG